jgi:IMP dehydrogenase/GMP reductase
MKLDFNDLLIKPAAVSRVNSRTSVVPVYENGRLPLFTAPMDTVVSDENLHIFKKDFNICMPRKNDLTYSTEHFYSYGYEDFDKTFNELEIPRDQVVYALIDIANGHMAKLQTYISKYKAKFGEKLVLMVGNVASPETFSLLQKAGADYIRVGIGNGGGCLTTVQTGVGYPMASLIQECKEVRNRNSYVYKECPNTKIVADGGFKTYSDIIKALALGADYVMLGSMLNKMFESSGQLYNSLRLPVLNNEEAKLEFLNGKIFYKNFRGMSSKSVQKYWGYKTIKTSEGIEAFRQVEYTYDKWVANFIDYLKSAMSYCGAFHLDQFIGKPEMIEISQNSYNRFKK